MEVPTILEQTPRGLSVKIDSTSVEVRVITSAVKCEFKTHAVTLEPSGGLRCRRGFVRLHFNMLLQQEQSRAGDFDQEGVVRPSVCIFNKCSTSDGSHGFPRDDCVPCSSTPLHSTRPPILPSSHSLTHYFSLSPSHPVSVSRALLSVSVSRCLS